MVRVAEVAGAVLTGLGVTWALSKIDIGPIAIPSLIQPPTVPTGPQPPKPEDFTIIELSEGQSCSTLGPYERVSMPFMCIDGIVRKIWRFDETQYASKYTFFGYQYFVDSAASGSDYQDYLTGN